MKLLLVDGHYYLYRSFFAIRGLTNSRGEPTNAIYGFVKALRKMLLDLAPDFVAVIWDAGLPEHRMMLQPDYKQHREKMPDTLQVQQEPLRELVSLFGVKNFSLPNTEADDLIASYAAAAVAQGWECIIATNDKDILQLVNEHVSIYSVAKADVEASDGGTAKERGYALLGPAEVDEKWGVPPSRITDLLALTGDAADNIPGVPGVGKKRAAQWIQDFGPLDAILTSSNLPPKIAAKVEESRAQIEQNRLMVELILDLPLPVPIEELIVQPAYAELIQALRNFELRSLSVEVEKEVERLGVAIKSEPPKIRESEPIVKWQRLPQAVQGELF